jgi:hypothetical protein
MENLLFSPFPADEHQPPLFHPGSGRQKKSPENRGGLGACLLSVLVVRLHTTSDPETSGAKVIPEKGGADRAHAAYNYIIVAQSDELATRFYSRISRLICKGQMSRFHKVPCWSLFPFHGMMEFWGD